MPEKFKLLILSGTPLISIETTDEERATELVRDAARELGRPLFEWSMTEGLRKATLKDEDASSSEPTIPGGKPIKVLERIRSVALETIYLFKDIGPHSKDAQVHRMLRDVIPVCEKTRSTLILVDSLPLPPEIKPFTVRYELGWPTAEELDQVVRTTFRKIAREGNMPITSKITKREMEQLVQCLRGLSCREAERVIASAIYADSALSADDLPRIIEAKRTLLGSTGCLESIAADFAPEDIGGLDNLKAWLRQRRDGFSPRAREFGLPSPRGVLMLGVPGSGKSLCAKVVAADWHMPLLRLDPGVLYQKFIGESESQLRQALAQAEAMAPCVLWIDEIEKAFASASAASADGGLSKRMFGTLLSWMQDHRHPIFIVATANDVSALPPELMRKGRFDEIFFVDLPGQAAREQIFAIHLRRQNRDPNDFNLKKLAEATDGFVGSELEQAVISGLFAAYAEKADLNFGHLIDEIQKTRPLSVLQAERVSQLRHWAKDRCVPAD